MKQRKGQDFWGKANAAFSAKDRRQHNKWRSALYVAADDLRHSLVFGGGSVNEREHAKRLKAMYAIIEMVTHCPIMQQ